jgi:ribulose-phosphate 3-epimerase
LQALESKKTASEKMRHLNLQSIWRQMKTRSSCFLQTGRVVFILFIYRCVLQSEGVLFNGLQFRSRSKSKGCTVMPKIEIMPSILAADVGNLESAIHLCQESGADQIHVDVMDGVFVPNISMGPAVVAMANRVTDLPLDVHLMLIRPQQHIEAFAKAGADALIIHIEADCDVKDTLKKIRDLGCRSGITLNPPTSVESIFECLDDGLVDEVLVMSVNPGFGGQSYIADTESKVTEIRRRYPEILISIDGGIDLETVKSAAAHGANLFVAGTGLFKAPEMKTAIARMRANAEAAYGTQL